MSGAETNRLGARRLDLDAEWPRRSFAALGMVLALAVPLPTWGFVGEVNVAGQSRRWALNPIDGRVPATSVDRNTRSIIYHLDARGFSSTNTMAELDAVRAAFDQWGLVGGTHLKFQEGATLAGTQDVNGQDGVNSLFWTTNLLVNGGRDNLSGVLALTYVTSFSDGNVITDADTVFNGSQYRWFTDASDTSAQGPFVEAIALHEIGHFLGLRHSPVGGATMLFVGDFGVNSQVGLAQDEFTAAQALYGTAATAAAKGRVAGLVRAGTTPVMGAAVFAEGASGNVVAGTVSRTNGAYELPALPPGTYTIRVAPLDPSTAANYLIRGTDIAPAYRVAQTEFLPSTNRTVVVVGGGSVALDFLVEAGTPLRMVRLLRPSADLGSPSYNNKPVSVVPSGQRLYVGGLTTAVLDGNARLFVTGDGLEVGSTEVRGNVLGALSLVAVPVRFATNATPGLRSLRLESGGKIAWVHGFLEVLPAFPDANFDGFDDRFQRRYWHRFTLPEAAPSADPDQDGFDNRWEYDTGTNPTNRLSARFEILSTQVTREGTRVEAQTAAGKRFQLTARDNLPGSEWQTIGNPVLANAAVTAFVDATSTNRVRFYRVLLLP
ncbi:MAG: matrixin family metalloprotease [Verrucomicrobiales bacterium]|nr:matrixin family metalloprotease [Verrucomicrobiales bacterium]